MAILNKDNFLKAVEEKAVNKVHKADFKVTKSGWVQCTKPNGDNYGLIKSSLVSDIKEGNKKFISYDDVSQILEFEYVGNSNPFK